MSRTTGPSFEIVHERDVPRAPRSGVFLSIAGRVRSVIEGGYVALAVGLVRRTESLEDALAARRHRSLRGQTLRGKSQSVKPVAAAAVGKAQARAPGQIGRRSRTPT